MCIEDSCNIVEMFAFTHSRISTPTQRKCKEELTSKTFLEWTPVLEIQVGFPSILQIEAATAGTLAPLSLGIIQLSQRESLEQASPCFCLRKSGKERRGVIELPFSQWDEKVAQVTTSHIPLASSWSHSQGAGYQCRLRNRTVGFISQFCHWCNLFNLSVLQSPHL